jgi:hypothetical protein
MGKIYIKFNIILILRYYFCGTFFNQSKYFIYQFLPELSVFDKHRSGKAKHTKSKFMKTRILQLFLFSDAGTRCSGTGDDIQYGR